MRTKRTHEGWLLIDHRACAGLVPRSQLPAGELAVAPGALYESATYTCSHCQAVVVMRPDRTRPRGYCPGCDHYVCDACEAVRAQTGCRPFGRRADAIQTAALRGRAPSPLLQAGPVPLPAGKG